MRPKDFAGLLLKAGKLKLLLFALLAGGLVAGCSRATAGPGLELNNPATTVSVSTATVVPDPTGTDTPLPTATVPALSPTSSPTPSISEYPGDIDPNLRYISLPGDTLQAVARRYEVSPLDIHCNTEPPGLCLPAIDPEGDLEAYAEFNAEHLLPAGTELILPAFPDSTAPLARLLPDSEVILSTSGEAFDLYGYVEQAGGTLASHRQYLMLNAWNSGADIIHLVSVENSINPRLLLALLEYQCRCVLGQNDQPEPFMGVQDTLRHDLYGQLIWAIYQLSNGYYGWRQGTLNEIVLADGSSVRLHPASNAGSAALYQFFGQIYSGEQFWQAVDPENGFMALYESMFGDPWQYESQIFPNGIIQPELALPFEPGLVWAYTGGPHPAYEGNGPFASLDFAPSTANPGCQPSDGWVTAMADGLVVRAQYGMVMQDLDGDGSEQTGWNLMYLHIGEADSVAAGTYLHTGDRVGKPTCEGGVTTGTHLHVSRKYNGEWIPAGSGPMPFIMDGWMARDGEVVYKGTLIRDDVTLIACTCSWRDSWIENERALDP